MAPGPNFKDKLLGHKAVVIGGSRGIGLGVAEAFLSFGAHVHIIGRTAVNVEQAIALLKEEYPDPSLSISGSTADATDEAAISEVLRQVAPVDHIVYTAVDARIRGPIGTLDIADAKDLFGVKFWGQVAVAKAIANHDIVRRGGSYTVSSGTLSLRPEAATAVGGALNAAVNSLTKGLAIDLAPKGVRVNAVVPGFVTSTHETITPERDAALKKRANKLLTDFVGTTEDIAEAYLYLARARYTTGTLSVVDGGLLLG
ncbi:SDR family oxidoreductase [Phanerochaete sordida]|uniref:SDR family oxidoreductase n=1 Tax=Phanerochaete sordida TaxID=48140 RepID=A0A9P3LAG9_9APHY|nr:SDR family oxidoreductase [Phanerochaete sordida]